MRGQSKLSPAAHRTPVIGVDLMSSDTTPEALLEAIVLYSSEFSEKAHFVVFATEPVFSHFPQFPKNLKKIIVTEAISHEDDPLTAIRKKKDSSLLCGMQMLKKRDLDAFVSAGNTGALIAGASFYLPMLPGIDRPALLALMPTRFKEMAVLDVGANFQAKVEHLVQFANMGIAYQKARGIENPRVGLLNIGVEEKKGTPELREAYQRLEGLNRFSDYPVFLGNIEGRDVFDGNIDVLVTDGFTGNVFLKTSEGTADFLLELMQSEARQENALDIEKILNPIQQRLHHAEFPGAILCGVEGIVIKCHGESTPRSFYNAILGALGLIDNGFLAKIKKQLETV